MKREAILLLLQCLSAPSQDLCHRAVELASRQPDMEQMVILARQHSATEKVSCSSGCHQ